MGSGWWLLIGFVLGVAIVIGVLQWASRVIERMEETDE